MSPRRLESSTAGDNGALEVRSPVEMDLIQELRGRRRSLSATSAASLVKARLSGPLTQSVWTASLKSAFPDIPLRTVIAAGGWQEVSDGGLGDDELNQLLAPWLPGTR